MKIFNKRALLKKFGLLVFLLDQTSAGFLQATAYVPSRTSALTSTHVKTSLPDVIPKSGLIVFPEAGRDPWIKGFLSAKKSIQIAAYKLSDPQLIQVLLEARRINPKLKIDLLIQAETFSHEQSANVTSPIEKLKEAGINVHTLSSRFNQAHYKMFIVDGKWGMVSSGNCDAESFDGVPSMDVASCRDFAITVTDKKMVTEMQRVFQADISDKRIVPTHPKLVWGPDNQRSTFLKMINGAKKSIKIYQQDIQDVGLSQALAGAARAGVKVDIIMMEFPFSKTNNRNLPNQTLIREAGGKVHLHNKHYIHAKLVLVDDESPEDRLVYVGSCNFYPDSLDQTRELGVLSKDESFIEQVLNIFNQDMQQAQPTLEKTPTQD